MLSPVVEPVGNCSYFKDTFVWETNLKLNDVFKDRFSSKLAYVGGRKEWSNGSRKSWFYNFPTDPSGISLLSHLRNIRTGLFWIARKMMYSNLRLHTESFHCASDGDVGGRKRLRRGRRCWCQNMTAFSTLHFPTATCWVFLRLVETVVFHKIQISAINRTMFSI